jgi:hypothetical protein
MLKLSRRALVMAPPLLWGAKALAECAPGYSQITVPLCQLALEQRRSTTNNMSFMPRSIREGLRMAILLFLFALFAFPLPLHAECAAGYHQIAVPVCAPVVPMTNCSVTPATTQAGNKQMAILAPCSPNVATSNQVTTPALIDVGIADATATVAAGSVPISVQAQGAGDVEVWMHGAMATRLTPGTNGMFTGALNLSSEPAGPLHVMFNAWDVSPPATPALHLQAEYTFVRGGHAPGDSDASTGCWDDARLQRPLYDAQRDAMQTWHWNVAKLHGTLSLRWLQMV